MDYKTLDEDQKRNAILNRLVQLEQEHYENSLYLEEAKLIGASDQEAYETKLASLEPRIAVYQKQLEELSE
jgi:hypothetical protein